MAEDHYATLGVKRDASQADIQKAYREMARKYHPDLHPDDKTAKKKFQDVQKAFEVLNDTSKREMYDRYGNSFEQMGAGPGPRPGGAPWPGGQPGGGSFEEIDISQLFGDSYGQDTSGGFGDIFNQFRRANKKGRRPSGPEPVRGGDLETELEIPFATAVTGGEAQKQSPSRFRPASKKARKCVCAARESPAPAAANQGISSSAFASGRTRASYVAPSISTSGCQSRYRKLHSAAKSTCRHPGASWRCGFRPVHRAVGSSGSRGTVCA